MKSIATDIIKASARYIDPSRL